MEILIQTSCWNMIICWQEGFGWVHFTWVVKYQKTKAICILPYQKDVLRNVKIRIESLSFYLVPTSNVFNSVQKWLRNVFVTEDVAILYPQIDQVFNLKWLEFSVKFVHFLNENPSDWKNCKFFFVPQNQWE